jgi:hypothetical protein
VLRAESRRLTDFFGNLVFLLPFRQFAADKVVDLACRQFVVLQILDNWVGFIVVIVDEGRDRGFASPLRRTTKMPCTVVDEIAAWCVLVLTARRPGHTYAPDYEQVGVAAS